MIGLQSQVEAAQGASERGGEEEKKEPLLESQFECGQCEVWTKKDFIALTLTLTLIGGLARGGFHSDRLHEVRARCRQY